MRRLWIMVGLALAGLVGAPTAILANEYQGSQGRTARLTAGRINHAPTSGLPARARATHGAVNTRSTFFAGIPNLALRTKDEAFSKVRGRTKKRSSTTHKKRKRRGGVHRSRPPHRHGTNQSPTSPTPGGTGGLGAPGGSGGSSSPTGSQGAPVTISGTSTGSSGSGGSSSPTGSAGAPVTTSGGSLGSGGSGGSTGSGSSGGSTGSGGPGGST